MPKSQTIEEKAHAYLLAGKVRVVKLLGEYGELAVTGSGDKPYTVRFSGNVWSCDCPAHVLACAHVVASWLITPTSFVEQVSTNAFGADDPELDEMFDKNAPILGADDYVEWGDV